MERRGFLGVVAGVVVGWAAASSGVLGGSGTARDGNGRDEATNRTPATTGVTATATDASVRPSDGGSTAEADEGEEDEAEAFSDTTETPEPTPTAEPTSTDEPTPESTPTPEPENLQEGLDVHTNTTGVGDEPGEEVSIVYVIRNEHEFAVDVSFQATLRLADGKEHRTTRFTRIDAGSLTSGKIRFDDHEQRASGWGFSLREVERASN